MPVLMHARLPGMTADEYDAVIAQLQENLDGETPDGVHFHVAGPIEDDWQVIEVWDSEGHHQAFLDEYISVIMESNDMSVEPVIQYWELHSEVDLD